MSRSIQNDDRGEPPEESRRRAEHISNALLDREEPDETILGDVAIADVEEDISGFNGEVDFLTELDLSVPALLAADGGVIPMALELVTGLPEPGIEVSRQWIEQAFEVAGEVNQDFRVVPPEAARAEVRWRLTDFLTIRIGAYDRSRRSIDWPGQIQLKGPLRRGTAAVAVPGCLFRVDTASTGLSVRSSGSYVVCTKNTPGSNFGGSQRTTPVDDVLQSGSYLFGVVRSNSTFVDWVQHTIVTLPGTPSVYLNK